MTIRAYTEIDRLSIINIYNGSKLDELKFEKAPFTLTPLEHDEKRRSELFDSNIFMISGLNSGKEEIAGYIAFYRHEIRGLNVLPQYRGQGKGKQLFDFALKRIKGKVSLQVVHSNAPSKHLYHGFGFKAVEQVIVNYNGMNVLVDRMVLNPR